VEKYGTDRQATDENKYNAVRGKKMLFECWITKTRIQTRTQNT